jgi:hypothetical protein
MLWRKHRLRRQTHDPAGPPLLASIISHRTTERRIDHYTDDGFWRRINRRFPFIGHRFCAACLLTFVNEDGNAVAAYRDWVRRQRHEAHCWRLVSTGVRSAGICLEVCNSYENDGNVNLYYHDEYAQRRDDWERYLRASDALRRLYDDLVDEQFAVALMLAYSGDIAAALALRELLTTTTTVKDPLKMLRRSVAKHLGDLPFRLIPGIMQAWDTWRDARRVSVDWPWIRLDLQCSDTMWSFPYYSFEELSDEQKIHWLCPFLERSASKLKKHHTGWPVAAGTFPI